MERSPELEALFSRWIDAFTRADVETVTGLLSQSEEAMWVGTDPDEEWIGRRQMESVMRSQIAEMGAVTGSGFPLSVDSVIGFCEATVGWLYATTTLNLDEPVVLRFTVVLHLEQLQWKAVHIGVSIPVLNVESLGIELTTSVDLVAQAVAVERSDVGPISPDGTVTLLFTDIEGSTERNAAAGDNEWIATLRHHNDLVRRAIAANDGFEVKSMGDGFMIAFSSARRGLQCALDVQAAVGADPELDLRVRVGVHVGDAIKVGDDFYGGVVNMAARVAGQAKGGEILASELVKGLVASTGDFTFAPVRQAELKGFPGTTPLYALQR